MDSQTKFFEAIMEGEGEVVSAMLTADPSLSVARTEQGTSAVLLAVYYNEPEIAALLVQKGPALDLFEAVALGDLAVVSGHVAASPNSVNQASADGFGPLGFAAFFGHEAIARLLLEAGADVNARSQNAQQVMPLHSAVAGRHLAITRMLLEAGASPNAPQADGFTPLHEAAQNGQMDMVQLLLAHGATRNTRRDSGETALDMARDKGHDSVAALLSTPEPQEVR